MKNIHILPTDKPSRLFITDGKLFNYHKPQQGDGVKIINVNIYITNSEEIKDGDYGLVVNEILSYNKMIELWGLTQGWKIILTTDQDLIKDGVQLIDDNFLEWFVKNPSCAVVEVKKESEFYRSGPLDLLGYSIVTYKIIIPEKITRCCGRCNGVDDLCYSDMTCDNHKERGCEICYGKRIEYQIIIPKEEVKQETQGYICPQTKKQCDDECCVSAEDCHIEASFDIISDCEPPKQETLEEAARNYRDLKLPDDLYDAFIVGAKWQQEQEMNCKHNYTITAEQGHRVIKCSKCNDTQPI